MYDLVIIGGGPAGAAAAVYAACKQLKTVLITESFGGQSIVSDDIQNWIGTPHISGQGLADALKAHVLSYAGDMLTIVEGEWVSGITQADKLFTVTTGATTYTTKTILLATGSKRRKLDIPGAAAFENKGITYCASCDGPMFGGQTVAVIGGGNAAFESAAQLMAYCEHVYIVNRSETFRCDEITVNKLRANPKITILTNAVPTRVEGDKFVSGFVYTDTTTGEERILPVTGVFVEIGQLPNTDLVKSLVELDKANHIKVDPRTQRTSVDGIWAAGDATDGLYHQNNIAAGDAVKALEDLYQWIHLHT